MLYVCIRTIKSHSFSHINFLKWTRITDKILLLYAKNAKIAISRDSLLIGKHLGSHKDLATLGFRLDKRGSEEYALLLILVYADRLDALVLHMELQDDDLFAARHSPSLHVGFWCQVELCAGFGAVIESHCWANINFVNNCTFLFHLMSLSLYILCIICNKFAWGRGAVAWTLAHGTRCSWSQTRWSFPSRWRGWPCSLPSGWAPTLTCCLFQICKRVIQISSSLL